MNRHDRSRTSDSDGGAHSSATAAPGKRTLTQGLPPRAARPPGARAPASPAHDVRDAAADAAPHDDPFGLHLLGASPATAPSASAVEAAARAGLGDVSGARLHDDPAAHATADAHDARALTVGPDVYFGAGQFRPGTPEGDHLLGHELAHTTQQRTSGTTAIAAKLRTSEPGDAAEVEADRAGDAFAAALTGGPVAPVTVTAAPVSIARAPLGQSRPLDPLGQSRPLSPGGQSFADPSVDADADGHADPIRAPAPQPKPRPAPLGQSRPLDPRGQSHPITLGGQSFADPSRDQDGDGHADPIRAPSTTDATDAPPAKPSAQATELAATAQQAIEAAGLITTGLLPTYTAAIDALDLAAVHAAAVETIGTYQSAAEVRDAIRARLAAPAESPELAADHGLLTPMRGALDAALTVAEAALATGLGVQRFRGQAVMAGVAPIRLAGARFSAGRLLQEAGFAEALIATVHEIAALVPAAAAASAEEVSIPTPSGASAAAAKVQEWAGRPVHFAFLRAALSSLGIWSQIEHANIAGDLRTLGQLGGEVDRNAARFGAMNDVGRYDAGLAASLLLGEPSRENVVQVLGLVESAAPDARGPILEDLQRRGLLDGFAERLSYEEAERLHDSVRDSSNVRSILRNRYGEDPRAGDNSVTTGRGRYVISPLLGLLTDHSKTAAKAYRWAYNTATFGFAGEHDAALRAKERGEMTEEEYAATSWKALARAGAVAVVSTATGGAAGSYVEGLTASLAARGVAGRIAANTAVGIAGGAAGNVGARAGSDLVDGELSSGGTYAHDAIEGGAIGGGLGLGLSGLGAAAARYVPEHLKTPIHRLVERFPAIADDAEIFGAIRDLGERHSQGVARFKAPASKVLRLAADGVVTIGREVMTAIKDPFIRARNGLRSTGQALRDLRDNFPGSGPQLVGAGGGGGSFTFTAEAARPLHVPGPDGPALRIIEAESDDLASHADDFADPMGGRDALDMMDENAPRSASWDEVDDLGDDLTHTGGQLDPNDLPSRYADLLDDHADGVTVRTHNDAQQSGIVPAEGAVYTDQHHVFPDEHREWFADPENVVQPFDVDEFTLDIEHELHGTLHAGRGEWSGEWNASMLARLQEARTHAGHPLTIVEMEAIARQELGRFKVPEAPYRRYTGTKDTAARRRALRSPPGR